ncbi:hypothetical protein Tco_0730523 [Tanacetum coccineum]|uniref:Uncharacterized protein n=1 Tax=Tanacetum coccineum TaxID=301880 RepID=A0ABQ4YSX2_9ASTR
MSITGLAHGYTSIRSNPRYGRSKSPVINAKSCVDTDETLASAEVSMAKMKGKRECNLDHEKGIYEISNAMMFVPQKELSREQVLPPSQVLAALHNIKAVFPQFDVILKERTTKYVQTADDTIVKEVVEFKEIHYALEDEYERFPNCLCEELRSNCDREHSKVVELEAEILKMQQMLHESEKCCTFIKKNHVNLQVKIQKYKECLQNQRVCDTSNSTTSNAIFEINKLKDQLQGKDDTIRNLQTQINITRMLNVGSTVGSFDKQALETELSQLKDALTSVRIQLDSYKVENVNLKRRYEELSNSNTYSRSTFTAKINALTAETAKLKTNPKYIPPQRRVNRAIPTPLPKKQQVTFQETPRTSNRPTQKPPVQQNKKPNVLVNLSTRTKPATESRKPMPKSHTRNHRILPSKSVNARRAADHNRK